MVVAEAVVGSWGNQMGRRLLRPIPHQTTDQQIEVRSFINEHSIMTEKIITEAQHLVLGQAWHQRFAGWLFRNHRWFGVVACVAVMLWAASGILHPIMSRLNPQPVNAQVQQTPPMLHGALTPSEVLTRAGIKEVSGLRVLAWNDASYYQVSIAGQNMRRYFEVNSGTELPDGDARYAEFLAHHFVYGEQGKDQVASVTRLEQFDDDYLSVNRLLPVVRVNFLRDDGLRAYVETSPPRLASLVDDTKATLSWLFRVIHQWDFMNGWDNTRIALMTGLLSMALLSALSGIWMYGFLWRRGSLRATQRPLRRWHRSIGIAVSLSTLLFTSSGAWHLLGSERRDVPTLLASNLSTAGLGLPDSVRHGNWGEISVVKMDGQICYQLTSAKKEMSAIAGEHDHSAKPDAAKPAIQTIYIHAANGGIIPDAERRHAAGLAGQYSGLPDAQITAISLVTKFEGEYGFINKRLPVWRVDYATPDHAAYYVETSCYRDHLAAADFSIGSNLVYRVVQTVAASAGRQTQSYLP